MMKRFFLLIMFLSLAQFVFGQTLQDSIAQAKTAYGRGQYGQAISIVDSAAATYAVDFSSKSLIADTYNDIGQSEYNKLNYLNAYECFRKAVKVYPTHKAASDNFWKMKSNFDVTNLKNEGTATASTDKTADSSTSSTAGETDTERKLQEAEAMLRELQSTSTTTTTGTSDELKRYQQELEKQQALIRELQNAYLNTNAASSPQDSAKTQELIDNLVKLYQVALATSTQPGDQSILAAQMKEYRSLLQEQQSSNLNFVIIAVASSVGIVAVILFILFLILLVARKRQKQRFAYATDFDMGLGYRGVQPLSVEEKTTRLLGYEPPQQAEGEEPPPESDEAGIDAVRHMIRAERLKQMQNEKKYGTLRWETLRKYISELEKDLRSDILYVVESKIDSGEVTDMSRVLPVLFPFLTDTDDYLRNKARQLITDKALSTAAEGLDQEPIALLEYGETTKKSKDPLSIGQLMRHVDKLKNTKTARREHCIATAKYARGISVMIGTHTPQEQDLLYKTALVHDAGYLLLDKEKLDEVESKKELSGEEMKFIHQHPRKGVEYFKDLKIPTQMRDGILYHHERNDGSGYPEGLKREKIPDFAKIIGIADSFDALTTNRVFRDKLTFDSAIVIMKDLGRSKFEANYLEAFIEYLKKTGKIKR